jgi:hypothetical protein
VTKPNLVLKKGEGLLKKSIVSLIALTVTALMIGTALAAGNGLIRLDPHGSYYPEAVMLESPATFNVYIQSGPDAIDPHIFLVMTESCYEGLTSDVTVDWENGGSPDLTITSWTIADNNGDKVPPGCVSGADYTVASLKDHLDTDEPIYWAFEPFLSGPITETPQEFTVTLESNDPRMMVYALGKVEGSELFSNKVPPTQPGFVVPEVPTALLAIASMGAFAMYALIRKRNLKLS